MIIACACRGESEDCAICRRRNVQPGVNDKPLLFRERVTRTTQWALPPAALDASRSPWRPVRACCTQGSAATRDGAFSADRATGDHSAAGQPARRQGPHISYRRRANMLCAVRCAVRGFRTWARTSAGLRCHADGRVRSCPPGDGRSPRRTLLCRCLPSRTSARPRSVGAGRLCPH